jgi:hypothetical protein
MPDRDDKNKGHTSQPEQYERSKKEVEGIEDGRKPSFKSANDREANAPRNNDEKTQDERDAQNVPSSQQG